MRTSGLALALILLLAAAPAVAQEKPKPVPLPEDVAAIIRGSILSRDRFRSALVDRYGSTEDGQRALSNLVEEIIIDAEREKRGTKVTQQELEKYVEKAKRDVRRLSAGTQTLQELLDERKVTLDDFLEVSRDFLIRQKMAAEDLGKSGELNQAELGVWMEGLKKRHSAIIGGEGLPKGVVAKVDGRPVAASRFGRVLEESLPRDSLESALWDLVVAEAVHQDLDKAAIEIETADIERALAEMRDDFKEDVRWQKTNFTFEQYVKAARRMTLDQLRRDRLFLAQVGLAKRIRGDLTAAEIKTYWEENRDRFGELRTFTHLLVKADSNTTPFGQKSRDYKQAKEIIDALYARFLKGTPFERLVIEASEDRSRTARPERAITVSRATPLPENMKKRIFTSPIGEVVGPIRTTFGYHLVKVLEIRPDAGFETNREAVAAALVRVLRTRALLEIRKDRTIRLRY